MDSAQYREFGKRLIDYTAEYHEKIANRPVVANVEPGYLRERLPASAPEEAEPWEAVLRDVDEHIMPGITHWQHPNFHAYYPTAHSFAATCGDILSDTFGCIGFTWASCPAYTELEVIVLDWLVQMIGLPNSFLSTGKGGGVINNTASEVTLTMLYAARSRIIEEKQQENPDLDKYSIAGRLVAYYSEQAHSSVGRACLMGLVRSRAIPTDANNGMCANALEAAMREDLEQGRWPFFVCATLGTTNTCAFDDLESVGTVCQKFGVWLHVDAAYAGSFFILPETRHYLKGVELVDSFNFNGHKTFMMNFECSFVWVTDRRHLVQSFEVNPLYLQNKKDGEMPDFRHWHVSLGRRFRALKVWFVLRLFGVKGLQQNLRSVIQRAEELKEMLLRDGRYEIVDQVRLGLVCFRIASNNDKTKALLEKIHQDGRIYLVPSKAGDIFFLRVSIAYQTSAEDIKSTFNVIKELTDTL